MSINPDNVQISQYVRDKANRARLSIESYYAQSLAHFNEREERLNKLEKKMAENGKKTVLMSLLQSTLQA